MHFYVGFGSPRTQGNYRGLHLICIWSYGVTGSSKIRTSPTFAQPIRRCTEKSNVVKSINKLTALAEDQNIGNVSRQSNIAMIVLAAVLFICVNERVVMMISIIKYHILYNVSNWVVHDIVYKYCELSPVLPKYVWVDFDN